MTLRKYLVIAAITICATFGDFFLKIGMNQQPHVGVDHPLRLVAALLNPWVILGTATLICFFSSYITALSWADLTFVMPATALGYVMTALLSATMLHERVSVSRWTGITLITLAVGFVTRGPSRTVREPEGGEHASIPELRL